MTASNNHSPLNWAHPPIIHKPALDLVAIWVKCSRKDTWIKSLPPWWSRSSMVTLNLSTGVSFGSLLSFFTPGFCSQWPQTSRAADLPDTRWLKCDHTSGSPAFSLWKHEHDLLSVFFLPPRNTKNSFFPLLLSASHKDKQENLTADGLAGLFRKDHSL